MGRKARIRAERRLYNRPEPVPYKVALEVTLRFSPQEADVLKEFQHAVNSGAGPTEKVFSLEMLCRQAIFLTIQKSYEQAEKIQKQLDKEIENGKSTGGESQGDNTAPSTGEDAPSDTLAKTQGDTTEAPST